MNSSLSSSYILAGDIDCSETLNWNSGKGFRPIAPSSSSPFTGEIFGNGSVVSGLFMNATNEYIGLVAYNDGYIEQMGLRGEMVLNVDYPSEFFHIAGFSPRGDCLLDEVFFDGNLTLNGTPDMNSPTASGLGACDVNNSYSDGLVNATSISGEIYGAEGIGGGGGGANNSYSLMDFDYGSATIGGTSGVRLEVQGIFNNDFYVGNADQGIGYNVYPPGVLTNDYFNGPSTCYSSNDGTVTNCSSVASSSYFHNYSNEPMASWDFTNVWSDANNGSDYPVLQWEVDTTNSPPDQPTLNAPSDGASMRPTSPWLNVSVSDPDGDSLEVSFYANDSYYDGNTTSSDGSSWTTVSTTRNYSDPVVFATANSANSANGAHLAKVRSVQSDSFDIMFCEHDSTDGACGSHVSEDVGYLVAELSTLDALPGVEAGKVVLDSTSDSADEALNVTFDETFGGPAIVVAAQQTQNEVGEAVPQVPESWDDRFAIYQCDHDDSSTDACEAHGEETFAWIAIDPTAPLPAWMEAGVTSPIADSGYEAQSFSKFDAAPVVLATINSNNGGQESKPARVRSVSSSSADVGYCEHDGGDTCDSHAGETIGWLAVGEGLGLIGEVSGVADGGDAVIEWSGLESYSTYRWFANVSDGVDYTVSSTWSFSTNGAPSLEEASVEPYPAFASEDLQGYCSGGDADGDNLTYHYRWYANGSLDSSGSTTANNTPGLKVNVANVSGSSTSPDDEWVLSCRADDGRDNSSWKNSSAVQVHPDVVLQGSHVPSPYAAEGEGLEGLCDASGGDGEYYFEYGWWRDGLFSTSGFLSRWTSNESLHNGISQASRTNVANVFWMDGELRIIKGSYQYMYSVAMFAGTWNGTGWEENSSLEFPDNYYPASTVFEWDDGYHLLRGTYSNGVRGYSWSGSGWVRNTSLEAGFPSFGSYYTTPSVFDIDGSWHALVGDDYDRTIYGFSWNGSAWVSNSSVREGLQLSFGSYERPFPEVMSFGDRRWLFLAHEGALDGYVWNGSAWDEDESLLDGYDHETEVNDVFPAAYILDGKVQLLASRDESGTDYYRGFTLMESGGGVTSVHNLSSQYTSLGDNWTFSCRAFSAERWSSWDNSSESRVVVETDDSTLSHPDSVFDTEVLEGSCAGSSWDGSDVSYSYRWYRDGSLNRSGSAGSFPSGSSVNVDNVSSDDLSAGDVWTLSCRAEVPEWNGTWVNSTTTTVYSYLDAGSSHVPSPYAAEGEGLEGLCDASGGDGEYYFEYGWWRDGSLFYGSPIFDWVSNASLDDGLYHSSNTEVVDVFSMDGSFHLVRGQVYNTGIYGYSWNGSAWVSNSTVVSGVSSGRFPATSVFTWGDDYHLLRGTDGSGLLGYSWNGSGWERNTSLEAGFPSFGSYETAPGVFDIDGSWHVLVGDDYDRTIYGFSWNGSAWEANASLEMGLPSSFDSYDMPFPEVVSWGGRPLLFLAYDGNFESFAWNGSMWASRDDPLFGYDHDTEYFSLFPAVFFRDGSWNLLVSLRDDDANYYYDGYSASLSPPGPVNVVNLSSQYTSLGDNWTFSCRASSAGRWSPWDNSTASQVVVGVDDSSLSPSPAVFEHEDLQGSCAGSSWDGSDVSYSYRWYRDGSLNRSGSAGSFPSGSSVNVDNVSSDDLSAGDVWTLSCRAEVPEWNGTWLNSSVRHVYATAAVNASTDPAPYVSADEGLEGLCDAAGGNGSHYFEYRWWGDGALIDEGFSHEWEPDAGIAAGNIGSSSYGSYLDVFQHAGSYHMLRGFSYSTFTSGFTWNGSEWARNESWEAGLGGGRRSAFSVFRLDDDLHYVHGRDDGYVYARTWNGSEWLSNESLRSGVTGDFGSNSHPTVFGLDGGLHMVIGESNGLSARSWNGSQWLSNASLSAGLDAYDDAVPDAFSVGGRTFLLVGTDAERYVFPFEWNGSSWESSTIFSLDAIMGSRMIVPEVFWFDDRLRLLVSHDDGDNYVDGFSASIHPSGVMSVDERIPFEMGVDDNLTFACRSYTVGRWSEWDNSSETRVALSNDGTHTAPSPSVYDDEELEGWCEGSSVDGSVSFSYEWYRNGSLHSSGSTASHPSGSLVNVDNVSSSTLVYGDEWTFSCRVENSLDNGSWVNATPVEVITSVSVSSSIDPGGFAHTRDPLQGYSFMSNGPDGFLPSYQWWLDGVLMVDAYAHEWLPNASLDTDIPDGNSYTAPELFVLDGKPHLLVGDNYNYVAFAYSWNGSGWHANSSLLSGLPRASRDAYDVVSYKGDTFVFLGERNGVLNAFRWDGSSWERFFLLEEGLPASYGDYTYIKPSAFVLDDDLHLLVQQDDGTTNAYSWAGSGWVSNATVGLGVPSDSFVAPDVSWLGDDLLMLAGNSDGFVSAFGWNGSGWAPEPSLEAGLGDFGTSAVPSFGLLDGRLSLFVGDYDGVTEAFSADLKGSGTFNLDNVSWFDTSLGEDWTFSSRVFSGSRWSPWDNSSLTSVVVATRDASTRPTPAVFTSEGLEGSCRGESWNASDVSYSYRWFRNGVLNSSGTVSGQPSNVEAVVDTIPASWLSVGDNWSFFCRAEVPERDGSWADARTVQVYDDHTVDANLTPSPYLGVDTNLTGACEFVGEEGFLPSYRLWNGSSIFDEGFFHEWVSNSSLIAGLPADVGYGSNPAFFRLHGRLHLLLGEKDDDQFHAYSWNGSGWEGNSSLLSGLSSRIYDSFGTVTFEDDLYLFHGMSNGSTFAYRLVGDDWERDRGIESGLPADVGSYAQPGPFVTDGTLHLLLGQNDNGEYNPLSWNGSSWVSNTTVDDGLGSFWRTAPDPFYWGDRLMLFLGVSDGTLRVYEWGGSSWRRQGDLEAGFVDVGSSSAPAVEVFGGGFHIISGAYDGTLSGFSANRSPEGSYDVVDVSSSNTSLGDNWTLGCDGFTLERWVGRDEESSVISARLDNASISPSPRVPKSEDPHGFCKASSWNGSDVSYDYRWYLDGVLNESGSSAGHPSGVESDVDALPAAWTAPDDSLVFSCRAVVPGLETSWLNSSPVTVIGDAPVVENVTLSSSSGSDSTDDNLSVSFDVSDPDSSIVHNTSDWRLNGSSIARLNMPFNINYTSLDKDGVVDYSADDNAGWLGGGNATFAPSWNASCVVGGCYGFNGSQFIAVNDSYDGTGYTEVTVSAWVKTTNDNQIILSYDRNEYWRFGIGSSGDPNVVTWNVETDAGLLDFSGSVVVNDGEWHHLAAVYDNGIAKTYVDGQVDTETTMGNSFGNTEESFAYVSANSEASVFAGSHGTSHFIGLIDELLVFDRALSDEQVNALYEDQNASAAVTTLVSQETATSDVWSVNVSSTDTYLSDDSLSNSLEIVSNTPPVVVHEPSFTNSSSAHEFSVEAGVSDADGAGDIASTSISSGACSYSSNTTSGDHFNATYLCSGEPYALESVNVTFCDSTGACVTTITSSNTYPNQAPAVPVLDLPVDGVDTLHDRNVYFNWSSSDPEGDDFNYTLNVTNSYCADYLRTGISSNSHTTDTELRTDFECEQNPYFWKVRACDAWDCSDYSVQRNFSIEDYLNVVVDGSVDFPELDPGSVDDTSDGSPQPFRFRNDGNVKANLTNVSSTDLWDTVLLGTSYYRFKVNRSSSEPDSFDWASSWTSWRNVSVMSSNNTVLGSLNYSDAADEAVVDVAVEVPGGEPPGGKNAVMTFEWGDAR